MSPRKPVVAQCSLSFDDAVRKALVAPLAPKKADLKAPAKDADSKR